MAKRKNVKYKRVVLKLSGEALQGTRGYGIEPKIASSIARQIQEVKRLGLQVAVVIGGGNIFRGLAASANGMDRTTGDYIGMLATVMNGMCLQDALEKTGVPTRVQTAIAIKELAEPFIRRRAVRHLEKGRVVIFVGGTGSPYFTTDTTAALRASEINAEAILKATKVDGVYDKDPLKNPRAKKYLSLSYVEVLKKKLKIMDLTAVSLAIENKIPIVVFDLMKRGNIKRVILGEKVGTIIKEGAKCQLMK